MTRITPPGSQAAATGPAAPALELVAGIALLATLAIGCVSAPAIVLTDQKTALERQAAGEYHALENDLHKAGISAKGEDIPREELEAKNPDMGASTLGEVVQLYSAVRTDAEWIDELLVAACIGEAKTALLEQTPSTCEEELDAGQLTRVIERANLHRRQLWRLIHKHRPDSSQDDVRAAWRENHLQQVICGGQIQGASDAWEKKEC